MNKPRTPLEQRMLEVVCDLNIGEVVSFADVASRAGRPKASRAAGRLLSTVEDYIPWWRVVYSDGKLPPCNPQVQAARLLAEQVQLSSDPHRVLSSPHGRFQKRNGNAP